MAQWYCMTGGTRYGPTTEEEIRGWLAEGRLKPTDMVWAEGMPEWLPAGSALPGTPGAAAPGPLPPLAPGALPPSPRYLKPHRGTTVLVLSILGWVVCCICSIIAWVMANNDLREMDAGLMDPSGRDTTKTARIVAMVQVILSLVCGAIAAIVGLFGALSQR